MTNTPPHPPTGRRPSPPERVATSPVERFEEQEDDTPSPWGWFVATGISLVIAVLCATPVWDEITDGGGRRGWIGDLLGAVGPLTVAGIAIAVAIVSLFFAVRALRRSRP